MSLTTSEMKTLKALVHEHSQSRHPVKLMIVQAACNVRSESAREGVATDLGRLKAKGYVVRVVGNRWVPTPSGKQAAGYPAFSTKIASPKAVSEPCTEQAEKLDDPVIGEKSDADMEEATTRSGDGTDSGVDVTISASAITFDQLVIGGRPKLSDESGMSRALPEGSGLVTDENGFVTGFGVATPIKLLEHQCGACAEKDVYEDPAQEDVSAQGILDRACAHMRDRAATYNKPEGERLMGATVGAFREVTGLELTEEQGWLFMSLLKAVRSQQGGYRADSYEDGAAYFALAGEAAGRIRQ